MKMTRILCSLMLVTSLALPLGGCGRPAKTQTPAQPERPAAEQPAPPAEVPRLTLKVYLTRGEKIGVAGREVDAAKTIEGQALAAMQALVKGPTTAEKEWGLGTTIPDGTTVNGVSIKNGTATVDMSSQFQSGGGSLSMLLRVTQVVCTLTQFREVRNVAFALDGKKVEAIGGEGVIVDPPVDRADFEGQLPPVLVENPLPGETVPSPMKVEGSSNVFEAVHQLQLTDPEGKVIYDKPVKASSGTGTRGTWGAVINYSVTRDGLGEVIVFEFSPKDGKRIDIVEIPVNLVK